eukprot:gene12011-14042_t
MVLVYWIIDTLKENNNYVIDSIRHPDEVQQLRSRLPLFCLVGVDCTPEIRYQRTKERARIGDTTTFKEFLVINEKEVRNPDPKGQQ